MSAYIQRKLIINQAFPYNLLLIVFFYCNYSTQFNLVTIFYRKVLFEPEKKLCVDVIFSFTEF